MGTLIRLALWSAHTAQVPRFHRCSCPHPGSRDRGDHRDFTLVQQVMLRSLPVVRPDQLWRIGDAVRLLYSNGYMQGDGSFLPPNDWNFFSWEAYSSSALIPRVRRPGRVPDR